MNFESHNPTIILIAGKAQSGKTTLANYLKENLENNSKQSETIRNNVSG